MSLHIFLTGNCESQVFWGYEFFRLEVYLGLSTGGPLRLHGNCFILSFIRECMGINKFKLPYTCINYRPLCTFNFLKIWNKNGFGLLLFACRTVSDWIPRGTPYYSLFGEAQLERVLGIWKGRDFTNWISYKRVGGNFISVRRTQNMDPQCMDHPCGPTLPCEPPLIFEDKFYQRFNKF